MTNPLDPRIIFAADRNVSPSGIPAASPPELRATAHSGDIAKAQQNWGKAVEVAPDSESGRKAAAGLKQLGGGTPGAG